MIIRQAKLEDSFNLIRLVTPGFWERTDRSFIEGEYYKRWLKNFQEMINSSLVHIFVAEENRIIIGVVSVYLLPRLELAGYYAVVEDVFVKESERRKGIGTKLFEEAIAFMKEKDVKYVTLNTGADNIKAQEFYKRLGFENKEVEMTLRLQED